MPYQDQYVGSSFNPDGNKNTSSYINRIFGLSDYTSTGLANTQSAATTQDNGTKWLDALSGIGMALAQNTGGRQDSSPPIAPTPVAFSSDGITSTNPVVLAIGAAILMGGVYLVASK